MPKSKVRDVPEINAGSMADIAFLLLIFFIVATTMDVDSGISTKLPPMPENEQEPPPPLKERNVFQVLVNANNQILVEGEWSDISKLKDEAKEFINNNGKKTIFQKILKKLLFRCRMTGAPLTICIFRCKMN